MLLSHLATRDNAPLGLDPGVYFTIMGQEEPGLGKLPQPRHLHLQMEKSRASQKQVAGDPKHHTTQTEVAGEPAQSSTALDLQPISGRTHIPFSSQAHS